ncbi:ABC transporter substrate-binding protein [Dankookia sp. P2]|uniref:ABC transporter substrate-binding protein n=1 Tax=Dankookia sp. P2 TaxID=3423955 RepID=UPI003D673BBE
MARRRAAAGRPITLGVVFAYSSHNYLLRWWLASAGLDPDRDLRLLVVPPALCARRLADGAIDGFCAGEPWGSHAAEQGVGTIALSSGDIWPNHPEKVLAFAAAQSAARPGKRHRLHRRRHRRHALAGRAGEQGRGGAHPAAPRLPGPLRQCDRRRLRRHR